MTSVAARRMAGGEVWVASTGNDSTVVVTRWVVRVVVISDDYNSASVL